MIERILIVGLGSIGRRHAQVARQLVPDSQIAVLRRRACHDVGEIGINHCFTNLASALEFRPQVAVIANPANFHLEIALALARADVHLLVEKPIADTAHGVSELIELCRVRRLTLMVGYNLRFQPSLSRLRELIQERRVGRVLSVRAEVGQYLPSWRPGSDYRQSVSANSALGGGVLLELSHEIDYLRWLFGNVKWVSAVQRKQSELEIDVDDTAHLLLGFEEESGRAPLIAGVNLDLIRHDTTRSCIVIGETGSLRWNGIVGTLEVFERGAHAWQHLPVKPHKKDESYLAEWCHFLKCVSDRSRPLICGDDGLAVLRIIEAARMSSRAGSIQSVVLEGEGILGAQGAA
jgi:predicted dehydrogenase